MKGKLKQTKGITLIALIITIIVLLILAVVSILLVVNNGILGKAESAVSKYSEEELGEQIKLAYAEWQTAQFTGETRTAAEFMQAKLREILSDNKLTATEKNEKFTVKLSDETEYEYNKSTGVVGEKVYNYIKKSTKKEDRYVGCFADIDKDGTVDGVIFVDLLTGSIKDQQKWTDGDGVYTLPTNVTESNVNTYYISAESHYDPHFGTHPVISPKDKNGEKRFYIMSLSDFIAENKDYFWYYYYADGLMKASDTSVEFGRGKTNTGKMIEIWNANGVDGKGYFMAKQSSGDVWKFIQTRYNEGWFIPSRAEWSAFSNELGITESNAERTYGLEDKYWSSSQVDTFSIWIAYFFNGCMKTERASNFANVRLATTF